MLNKTTHLGPYSELTEEQKKLLAGTRLAVLIRASGHFEGPETALQEVVRTHNEDESIADIDALFQTRPDIFKSPVTGADMTTDRPVAVSRPLTLRRKGQGMGFFKKVWDKVAGNLDKLDDLDTIDSPFPTASTFSEMTPVVEAEFPIPETAPVVATGTAITVGRPLRFNGAARQCL